MSRHSERTRGTTLCFQPWSTGLTFTESSKVCSGSVSPGTASFSYAAWLRPEAPVLWEAVDRCEHFTVYTYNFPCCFHLNLLTQRYEAPPDTAEWYWRQYVNKEKNFMLASTGHVNSVYSKPDDSGYDNFRNMMVVLNYSPTNSALVHNRAAKQLPLYSGRVVDPVSSQSPFRFFQFSF